MKKEYKYRGKRVSRPLKIKEIPYSSSKDGCPDLHWNKILQTKYEIGIEEYNEMFVKQGGRCKICKRHQTQLSKRLAVDHDHITGKVRGLLCTNCNTGLGMFKDNPENLSEAIKYLQHC